MPIWAENEERGSDLRLTRKREWYMIHMYGKKSKEGQRTRPALRKRGNPRLKDSR